MTRFQEATVEDALPRRSAPRSASSAAIGRADPLDPLPVLRVPGTFDNRSGRKVQVVLMALVPPLRSGRLGRSDQGEQLVVVDAQLLQPCFEALQPRWIHSRSIGNLGDTQSCLAPERTHICAGGEVTRLSVEVLLCISHLVPGHAIQATSRAFATIVRLPHQLYCAPAVEDDPASCGTCAGHAG